MKFPKDKRNDFMESWAVRRQNFLAFNDDFLPDQAMFIQVEIPTKERHEFQPQDEGRIIKLSFADMFDMYCRVICFRIASVDTPWQLELDLIADSEHYFDIWGGVKKSIEWVGDCPIGITLNPDLISGGAIYHDDVRTLRSRYGPDADEKMRHLQQALYWFYRDDSEAGDTRIADLEV